MFGKLMKWEWKETAPFYGALYALAAFTALSCRSTGSGIKDMMKMSVSAGLLTLTLLASVGVFLVLSFWRYYDGVYGRRGYLNLTLPVTGRGIFFAKFFVNAFWGLLTAAIVAGVFWLFLQNETITADGTEVVLAAVAESGLETGGEGVAGLLIVSLAFSVFFVLARGYCSISLAQRLPFGKGNLVAAAALYMLFGKIELIFIQMLYLSWFLEESTPTPEILLSFGAQIGFCGAYLIASVYLVSKKLELQ